ncbi:neo-calmodulin-like [Asterias amurensis]|uniref:neo-calmodulin-like n=1 Tax=Asterias amurensis TaxID=7602 RepID=UPI003AB64352
MANPRYDAAFALFDADKDGKVSKSEFGAALKKLGRDPTELQLTELMKQVDKDANGFIDKNEFYQMMEAQKGKEKQNMQEAFKKFDKDGNGYISKSELKETMKGLGVTLTDADVVDIIKNVDVDHDGRISFAEFEKMMDNM